MSLAQFYTKIFGLGIFLGSGVELMLIKSNYYQMLAASEAKQRAKEQEQEQQDIERFKRIAQEQPPQQKQ
ncbi:hypothetical protein BDB00DRAFT_929770 [Zychaea mexicana]|uniref:uncharacterized protein n=1 Tax=Zychaea mexicana TaxID=64656 RepID=UPI0022FF08E2|nr:uncharacterized protein BDB00DRAFT_929770 [Zychaea mexicana]KAI9492392.1 hypothetical protein BDB00DRAFT_929770 [Zychaea mexicana]